MSRPIILLSWGTVAVSVRLQGDPNLECINKKPLRKSQGETDYIVEDVEVHIQDPGCNSSKAVSWFWHFVMVDRVYMHVNVE